MSSQPTDSNKSNQNESTRVARQHASVTRSAAAAAREQKLKENGLEPVSIWILLIISLIAMVAGSYIFQGNKVFNYHTFVKPGYVRSADPHGDKPSVPQGKAEDVYLAKGKEIFTRCAACHGADGKGNAAFPPLAGSEWVKESPFVPALAAGHGVTGPIKVAGKSFKSEMSPQGAAEMSPLELVSLIYYIQNNFGNKVGHIYSLDHGKQLKEAIAAHKTGPNTAATLTEAKSKKLKGDFLKPGTMINKKTGAVIK